MGSPFLSGCSQTIMNILIIGGTRNLGHFMVSDFLERGYHVTILNRGLTRDELPEQVERLRADRTDTAQLTTALKGRIFDVVIDNALYKQPEAEAIVKLLNGRVGHYIVLSSGQVYLVREGIERPFREDEYDGRLMPAPKINTFGFEEWLYGMDKRHVEDTLASAWGKSKFPYTALRLPMVNSERDHFNRLYAYILRLEDGGPILAPSTPNFRLRHVYGGDVVTAMNLLISSGKGKGQALNISQDETHTLEEFLDLLGEVMGMQPHLVRVQRDLLEGNGFLPDCSPFSERWMSELDNQLSKDALGMSYTPLRDALTRIVNHYRENVPQQPAGYRRRRAELLLVEQISEGMVSGK
jgi:nucleoside-diphosphate-sugar epimerase